MDKEIPTAIYDSPFTEGVIIIDPNGILYENQAGGVSCSHPQARGIFVPRLVPREIKSMWMNRLSLSDDMGKVVTNTNKLLIEYFGAIIDTSGYEHQEAWLPIVFVDGRKGILVWENSD